MYKYLKGGCEEDGASLPSGAQSQERGNGNKLEHRRLHLKIKKRFFTVRVTNHWHRLPMEVVESPSLEIFKNHLDTVLGN